MSFWPIACATASSRCIAGPTSCSNPLRCIRRRAIPKVLHMVAASDGAVPAEGRVLYHRGAGNAVRPVNRRKRRNRARSGVRPGQLLPRLRLRRARPDGRAAHDQRRVQSLPRGTYFQPSGHPADDGLRCRHLPDYVRTDTDGRFVAYRLWRGGGDKNGSRRDFACYPGSISSGSPARAASRAIRQTAPCASNARKRRRAGPSTWPPISWRSPVRAPCSCSIVPAACRTTAATAAPASRCCSIPHPPSSTWRRRAHGSAWCALPPMPRRARP